VAAARGAGGGALLGTELAKTRELTALAVVDPEGRVAVAAGDPTRLDALAATPAQPLALLPAEPGGAGLLVGVTAPLPGRAGWVRGVAAALPTPPLGAGLPDAELLVVGASGVVRWASGRTAPGSRVELPGVQTRAYRNASGEFVVGASAALAGLPLQLVLEQPFRSAFEPVFSVLTRVFVVDVCIILFFSFLAYQVTSAIVRPIEALSEGARRISQGQLEVEIPEARGQDEIGLLTRTFNDMTRKLLRSQSEIQSANAELKLRNEELQRANEVLEQLSITDGLTKLHNHRFFHDYLTREIKRVSRTGDPLSMLLVDIDDFKRLNDRLGHAAGDELLVGLARILNDAIRESDLAARYGGEEFVVLATETDLAGGVFLAEKIRTAIAEASFILDDSMQLTKMTVSIGVAQYRGSRKAFFQTADQALYRAKGAGKNCVVADEEEPTPGGGALPRHASA
jgi:diguanylate cyclase (GGDEF)-like protein